MDAGFLDPGHSWTSCCSRWERENANEDSPRGFLNFTCDPGELAARSTQVCYAYVLNFEKTIYNTLAQLCHSCGLIVAMKKREASSLRSSDYTSKDSYLPTNDCNTEILSVEIKGNAHIVNLILL